MKNKLFKKVLTAVLAAAMLMSSNGFTVNASAADKIYVEQVYAKSYKETMAAGTTKQLTVFVEPANATNKVLTYRSSNRKVATVSTKGIVTAVGTGTATITIMAMDGSGKTDTVKISVLKDLTITGKSVDADNEVIVLDKTYGNITVDSSVGDAVIYLSGVTVKNKLTLESGDYTLNMYDSTANKVVIDEATDEIVSLAVNDEEAKTPTLNVGNNTAISEIQAKVNAMIKQEDGSQIDGLRFEQNKEGKIVIYLEAYTGKLLVDSSLGDLEVVTTNCDIAEVLVTGGENAGNVQLTNGGDSAIENVSLIGSARLELAVPTTNVNIGMDAKGASFTAKDSVGTITNNGAESKIKITGSVDNVVSNGQKAAIEVETKGYIGTLNLDGNGSSLTGAGEVSEAYVNANDCNINTVNTLVMVGEKVLNAKVMGAPAVAGSSVTSQPPAPLVPFIPPVVLPEIPEDPSVERYFTSFYLYSATTEFALGDSTASWDPANTTVTKDYYLNGDNFKDAAAGAGITDPTLLNKFTTWAGVKEVVRGFEFTVTVNTGKSKDASTNLQADLIIQNEKARDSYNGSFIVISQDLGVKQLTADGQPVAFKKQVIFDDISGWDPGDLYMVKAAIRFTNTDEAVPVTGTVTVKVLARPKAAPTPTPTHQPIISANFEDGTTYGLNVGTGTAFDSTGYNSSKSIKVTTASQQWGTPGYDLTGYAGKTVTVIAYAKQDDGIDKMIAATYQIKTPAIPDGDYQGVYLTLVSGEWTKVVKEVTIPADATEARLYFEGQSPAPVSFNLDNVLIYQGNTAQAEAAYATLFPVTTITPLNVTADMETSNPFANYRSLGNFGHTGGETTATYAVTGSAISPTGYNSEKSLYIDALADWHGVCYYINNTDAVAVTYTVSARVKLVEGIVPKVRIQTQGGTTGVGYQNNEYNIVSDNWTLISTTIEVPAEGSVRMELKPTTNDRVVFLVDDFKVTNQ